MRLAIVCLFVVSANRLKVLMAGPEHESDFLVCIWMLRIGNIFGFITSFQFSATGILSLVLMNSIDSLLSVTRSVILPYRC